MNLKYDYIIWDFNGTIFDDVQIDIDSLNVLLEKRGLPVVNSREEYKEGFMFPIKQWYVNRGFDFEKESFDDVAVEWLDTYLSREPEAGLVKGVAETLEFFRKMNVKQVIISASEISMLRRQLKMLGVEEYFEEILGLDNYYAAGKKGIALEWRKKHPTEKLLFLGDTDHDYFVAEAIEADCVLISEGHQSADKLRQMPGVMAVLESQSDVVKLFC
jgi:phosphoglycolate phosphatase